MSPERKNGNKYPKSQVKLALVVLLLLVTVSWLVSLF